jgi:hypothetical protein
MYFLAYLWTHFPPRYAIYAIAGGLLLVTILAIVSCRRSRQAQRRASGARKQLMFPESASVLHVEHNEHADASVGNSRTAPGLAWDDDFGHESADRAVAINAASNGVDIGSPIARAVSVRWPFFLAHLLLLWRCAHLHLLLRCEHQPELTLAVAAILLFW